MAATSRLLAQRLSCGRSARAKGMMIREFAQFDQAISADGQDMPETGRIADATESSHAPARKRLGRTLGAAC